MYSGSYTRTGVSPGYLKFTDGQSESEEPISMSRMLSSRTVRTISEFSNALLFLTTICAIGLSCVALLSQAVRSAPNRSWHGNIDAPIIGASYAIVLVLSVLLCVKRRIAVRQRLQRTPKSYKPISRGEVPNAVHEYITQEYVRTCLAAYESLPKDTVHDGWGRPGTPYSGIYFRRALLDTVPEIDALAHLVVPSLPPLKPHVRMLHHFRFLLPLFPVDVDGLSFVHYYDSAIQLARNSSEEPTESEFEIGMEAASEIMRILYECRLEMLEGSASQLTTRTNPD